MLLPNFNSTCFAQALSAPTFTQQAVDTPPAIEVPDIDRTTFYYYFRCVLQEDATVKMAGGAAVLQHDSSVKEGFNLGTADTSTIMMQYCKGYYFATKVGDRAAADLIIDTLVYHCFEVNACWSTDTSTG